MKKLLILAVLMLAACAGGSAAPERYTLSATPLDNAPRCHASIRIHEPEAAPGIDSTRIAVIDRPHHLTHYQGVAWSSPAGHMAGDYLVDLFERSALFSTVASDTDTLPTTYSLDSRLRDFEVEEADGTRSVVIRLVATLSREDTGRIVKSFTLAREADAGGEHIDGIVAIFNEQMHSIGAELATGIGHAAGCR